MLDEAGFEFAFYHHVRLCQRLLNISPLYASASEYVLGTMRVNERSTWRESLIDCL